MKIAIAPDSFKECLTADEVAGAIEEGVRRALPDCVTVCVPMADGGEGTVDALIAATNGRIVELTGTGPMGTPVATRYGLLGDGESAQPGRANRLAGFVFGDDTQIARAPPPVDIFGQQAIPFRIV